MIEINNKTTLSLNQGDSKIHPGQKHFNLLLKLNMLTIFRDLMTGSKTFRVELILQDRGKHLQKRRKTPHEALDVHTAKHFVELAMQR